MQKDESNPKMPVLKIIHQSEEFLLNPGKTVFQPGRGMLFVADAHFGKAGTFRKGGIAIPSSVSDDDYSRLNQQIESFQPKKIVFLGDLFHHDLNSEWDTFIKWRQQHSGLQMLLIVGNHDRLDEQDYERAGLELKSEPARDDGLILCHHPGIISEKDAAPVLCGHVHPGVRLTGSGRMNEILPCFWIHKSQLMLPAFGNFTGLARIHPEKKDRVFAIAGNLVVEV